MLAKDDDLKCSGLIADDFAWPANVAPKEKFEAMVKIRLASKPVKCTVEPYTPKDGETFNGDAYMIIFDQEQRAVAPGQSAVIYKDGVISGGGVIFKSF